MDSVVYLYVFGDFIFRVFVFSYIDFVVNRRGVEFFSGVGQVRFGDDFFGFVVYLVDFVIYEGLVFQDEQRVVRFARSGIGVGDYFVVLQDFVFVVERFVYEKFGAFVRYEQGFIGDGFFQVVRWQQGQSYISEQFGQVGFAQFKVMFYLLEDSFEDYSFVFCFQFIIRDEVQQGVFGQVVEVFVLSYRFKVYQVYALGEFIESAVLVGVGQEYYVQVVGGEEVFFQEFRSSVSYVVELQYVVRFQQGFGVFFVDDDAGRVGKVQQQFQYFGVQVVLEVDRVISVFSQVVVEYGFEVAVGGSQYGTVVGEGAVVRLESDIGEYAVFAQCVEVGQYVVGVRGFVEEGDVYGFRVVSRFAGFVDVD